jgi:hypothetical protein
MSMTGLEVFDSTLHQTNAWLKSLMGKIGTGDRHQAVVAAAGAPGRRTSLRWRLHARAQARRHRRAGGRLRGSPRPAAR